MGFRDLFPADARRLQVKLFLTDSLPLFFFAFHFTTDFIRGYSYSIPSGLGFQAISNFDLTINT